MKWFVLYEIVSGDSKADGQEAMSHKP